VTTAPLEQYREDRRVRMHGAVRRALTELDAARQPVNISQVAAAAGVSRQWLYDSPFRKEIEELRRGSGRATSQPRPARESASENSLRSQLDTLRARLKETRAENAALRAELERALGMLREHRPRTIASVDMST
jgi:hypothetical protein